MTLKTSTDAYERYRLSCNGAPVLTPNELRVEIQAAGLRYEDLDDAFWATILRRPDHRHLGAAGEVQQFPSAGAGCVSNGMRFLFTKI